MENIRFDLSNYTFSDYYYHWCIFVEGIPYLQNKDLKTEDDVAKDILRKNLKTTFKVIKTIEPLGKMVAYFNKINNDIILFDDFLDENSIFAYEHNYIIDVTDDVCAKLV